MRELRVLTVPEAIEDIVRGFASTAKRQINKLARDREKALHDLRVSVRRIRTLLVAYKSFLSEDLHARGTELAAAMRQTNQLRDLEAHAEILVRILQHKSLPTPTRHALQTIQRTVRQRMDANRRDGSPTTARILAASIDTLLETLTNDHKGANASLYTVTTGLIVQRETNSLIKLARTLERKNQVKRLHRTRLAAKRLRYIIEPLPHQLVGLRDGLSRLKRLQTLLGDIRDLQTLRSEVVAMAASTDTSVTDEDVRLAIPVIDADESKLFSQFLSRKQQGQIARLEHRLRRIAGQLHTQAGVASTNSDTNRS